MQEQSSTTGSLADAFGRIVDRHHVDARLKRVDFVSPNQPIVRAHFLYPVFKGRKPTMEALAKMLVREVTKFCATRSERRDARRRDEAVSDIETEASEELGAMARKLFMTAGGERSGEGGELLLYALIEHYLKAPLVVSKMRLKTNRNMPVHGADGLHAAWCSETDSLILYFGESKMHKTFANGMRDAAESVAGLVTNQGGRLDQELRLISNFQDLDRFPEDGVEHLLRFLNPYETEEANRRIDRFAVLVGFDYHAYGKLGTVPVNEVEQTFLDYYKAAMTSKIETAQGHLATNGIELEHVDLFIFPVPSVDDFREQFQEAMNG
ncbi:DUF1837 domain-containing protein [Cupriavidus sp. AcVe19-6a]|uniref:HamA C-terminal domain-containing protein n=1 Tax=Cupriavidus sp. AcVe19-6a TaxID=2821358 RepID=UPI001AE4F451|nr:DUF1837 domain-containing protein [Cupriavidus sp. AcVe19-6a]MBP0639132.1 DUF1837 domain-containing protein [Cupriavidus sp. AcVe19-6a]